MDMFPFTNEGYESVVSFPRAPSKPLFCCPNKKQMTMSPLGVKNPEGSACHIIGVLKTIRNNQNKHDDDTIHVMIEVEE